MTRHETHFEEFRAHTRLKHAILDTYVIAWAMKLFMRPDAGRRLAIVDAFAGEGRDRAGHDGSPLIAIRRARQATQRVRQLNPRLENPEVLVFAIEEKAKEFRRLENTLAAYVQSNRALIHVLRGELANHIDEILDEIGDDPTFYFLDPYGIKGLDASTYPKALRGPHNELFALFSNIGAIRLYGLVAAERPDAAKRIAEIQSAPSFFHELDDAAIQEAKESATRANQALDATIPASRAHLSRALGGEEWIGVLERTPPEARGDTFLGLFREALTRAGARYVLSVPMRDDSGRGVYALVHASKSAAAFVAMKEAVSTALKKGDMHADARAAIRRDLEVDIAALMESLKGVFRGRRIPWALERTGMRDFLLANTALFHFQADSLKAALREAGILTRIDGKLVCVFPEAG